MGKEAGCVDIADRMRFMILGWEKKKRGVYEYFYVIYLGTINLKLNLEPIIHLISHSFRQSFILLP